MGGKICCNENSHPETRKIHHNENFATILTEIFIQKAKWTAFQQCCHFRVLVFQKIVNKKSLAHLAGVGPEAALRGEALATDVAVEGPVLQPLCWKPSKTCVISMLIVRADWVQRHWVRIATWFRPTWRCPPTPRGLFFLFERGLWVVRFFTPFHFKFNKWLRN